MLSVSSHFRANHPAFAAHRAPPPAAAAAADDDADYVLALAPEWAAKLKPTIERLRARDGGGGRKKQPRRKKAKKKRPAPAPSPAAAADLEALAAAASAPPEVPPLVDVHLETLHDFARADTTLYGPWRWRLRCCPPALRFPVVQPDKTLPCDDMTASGENETSSLAERPTNCTVDHFASMAKTHGSGSVTTRLRIARYRCARGTPRVPNVC